MGVVSALVMWLALGSKTIYENFDGPYYGVVATTWYEPKMIGEKYSFPLPKEYYAAHLPLYPLLMQIGGLVTKNVLSAGVLINIGLSAIGAWTIYLIWEKYKLQYGLWAGLAWLFVWPRMWAVRSIASPETLFIILIVLSLYFFDKKGTLLPACLAHWLCLPKHRDCYYLSHTEFGGWKIRGDPKK